MTPFSAKEVKAAHFILENNYAANYSTWLSSFPSLWFGGAGLLSLQKTASVIIKVKRLLYYDL